jgi:hypothetical protein
MTKPVIVTRTTKGSPLTYAEHDANFTNLQNATVSVTAGTGGTAVTSDLNGNITLVAGSGITLTGDNTAKTITIDSTAGTNSFANIAVSGQTTVAADSNTDTLTLVAGTGISLTTNATTDAITITNTGGTTAINSSGAMQVNLNLNGYFLSSDAARTVGGITYPADTVHVNDNLRVFGDVTLPKVRITDNDIWAGSSISSSTVGGRITISDRLGSGGVLTQVLIASANGAGTIEFNGNLIVNDPGGAPTDTATIVDWLKITVGSTVRYLPLYS